MDDKFSIIDRYRTALIVILSILIGTLLLVFGHYTESSRPLLSFLLLQFGALLIFGAGYTALNDWFIRKNFEHQVRTAIDFVRLDQSIKSFGLSRVDRAFSVDRFHENLQASSVIVMLVLRSNTYFQQHYQELRERIARGQLTLTVILPNPGKIELMRLLSDKFSDLRGNPAGLAKTIADVVNVWLRQQMSNLRTLSTFCIAANGDESD